jgi:ribosomal protein S12 methylthiotransferase accessory factor
VAAAERCRTDTAVLPEPKTNTEVKSMEIIVSFPGGNRVNAQWGSFAVETDQPKPAGGDGAAPTPFEVFLASLATCAGFYVLGFCKMRGIPAEGIRLTQTVDRDPQTKMVSTVRQEILLPSNFPKQYTSAVIRAAESCLVKKHLEHPPAFEIVTIS